MGSTIYRMKTYWASHRERVNAGNSPRLFQKTLLRFVTAHFALLGAILLAAAINPWQENFFHSTGSPGDWQDGFPIAPLLLSFLFNIMNSFYVFKTATPFRGLVTGIFDFLVWAILIPAVTFSAWAGVFNIWKQPTMAMSGSMVICDSGMNMFSKECNPELYKIGSLELAGIVFSILVWFITTFLFVHGCLEGMRGPRRGSQSSEKPSIPDRSGFYDLERGPPRFTRRSRGPPVLTRPPMAMPRYR
ncbi:hypothetical protein Plec18167_008895 [Paecilomyces lecythidis]|uniref:MARVEL domain-containing protein n=1 Tax=Paecilomyces lecythidis TaxID=3004212 RepID=A0ABR3WU36_9EURO